MGTNYYYWHEKPPCDACHREFEPIHIGKSSSGWTFSFHGTETIRSEDDWRRLTAIIGSWIEDEYSGVIPPHDFWQMVENKRVSTRNHAHEYPLGNWLDSKGNSFSGGNFS